MTTRLRQRRMGMVTALVMGVLGLSSCAKSESAECGPTFGGGIECTSSESFNAVEWAKDNPGLAVVLAIGAMLAGAWMLEQFDAGKRGAAPEPGQGAPLPSTMPRTAIGAREQQRIADNVRVGDRIITDVGPRRVLGISFHSGGAHLINLTLDDGATITVGRADTVRVVAS
jgi:hypothetical protein